jgi:hypothetical protein
MDLFEQEHVLPTLGEGQAELPVGEQEGDGGIFEQECQALGGIARIQGDISSPGFEDGQQAEHEVEATRQADADRNFRSHSGGSQVTGELIGAPIEVLIAEEVPIKGESNGIGTASDLCFDESMQTGGRWIAHLGGIPVQQKLLAFF